MKMLDTNQKALLMLVRSALGECPSVLPEADWEQVEKIAQEQGVLWMLYLGAKPTKHLIPNERLKMWRAVTHSGVVYNEQINAVQAMLLNWLKTKGVRAAILKGTSCSKYYQAPEVRPLGDIDVLLDADKLEYVGQYLEAKGYKRSSQEHGFHVGYYGKDTVIELHRTGTEVPKSKGGDRVKDEMKLFLRDARWVSCCGNEFPALSDEHQALMLLLHMERHMVDGGFGLRQMCDWSEFVRRSDQNHWTVGTLDLLSQCGLLLFAKVVTKTCVEYLGLDINKALWCNDVADSMVQAMMADVFRGGNLGTADKRGMGSLFTDRIRLGQERLGRLGGLWGRLTRLAYRNFPIARKYKFLAPLFCIYIPLRYLVRTIIGVRPQRDLAYLLNSSVQRQEFYKSLHLYEIQ